jgi:heat shock protein 4
MFVCVLQALESTCNPIINKPKPKVEPPKVEEPKKEENKDGGAAGDADSKGEQPDSTTPAAQPESMDAESSSKHDMDID